MASLLKVGARVVLKPSKRHKQGDGPRYGTVIALGATRVGVKWEIRGKPFSFVKLDEVEEFHDPNGWSTRHMVDTVNQMIRGQLRHAKVTGIENQLTEKGTIILRFSTFDSQVGAILVEDCVNMAEDQIAARLADHMRRVCGDIA